MWHLLRAEIAYHRFSLTLFITGFLGVTVAAMARGWESTERDVPGLGVVMFTVTAVLSFVRLLRLSAEKTDRYLFTLPLSARQIGVARSLYPVSVWLVLMLILGLGFLVIRPGPFQASAFFQLFSLSGFLLAANAFFLIHRDLTFCFPGRWQSFVLSGIYVAVMAVGTVSFVLVFGLVRSPSASSFSNRLFGHFLRPFLPVNLVELASTAVGATTMLIAGIGLTYVGVVIFQWRRSYLE